MNICLLIVNKELIQCCKILLQYCGTKYLDTSVYQYFVPSLVCC